MRVKILHRCWVEICIMSPFGLYRILWPRLTRNLYQPHHMNLCVHMFEWTQICMISYYSVSLIGQFINYEIGAASLGGGSNIFAKSQFEMAFSAFTMCICVCSFCLQVNMLYCFNVQICKPELIVQIQNTIWHIFLGLSSLRDTMQICKSKLT